MWRLSFDSTFLSFFCLGSHCVCVCVSSSVCTVVPHLYEVAAAADSTWRSINIFLNRSYNIRILEMDEETLEN